MASRVADPWRLGAVAARLPAGTRGVSIPTGNGLPVELGDRVDVLATFDPKDAGAHIILGSALKAQGKLEQAVAAYRKSIELEPHSYHPYHNLSIALCRWGKLPEAEAASRKAIALQADLAAVAFAVFSGGLKG